MCLCFSSEFHRPPVWLELQTAFKPPVLEASVLISTVGSPISRGKQLELTLAIHQSSSLSAASDR